MSSSINLISIGNKEFNLSLLEVKQFLKFNLFVEDDFKVNINFENYDALMVYEKNLDKKKIDFLNKLEKIVVLISEKDSKFLSNRFSIIKLPVKLDDINSVILNLNIKKKFSSNSSIKIKDFILNINERKISQNNQFIEITEKEIALQFDLTLVLSVVGLVTLVGIVAGSYPALYLSKMEALSILKGFKLAKSSGGIGRKVLVIFQFTLSTILIVSVMVVYQQMQLIQV